MFQQDMEASNREWRHQNGENRSWNDSEWQIESPPVPHFRTDPSYLHPVLSGSQRSIDPAFLRRDSMKSDTTYARVEDILEDPWPPHFPVRTDPLPPIPESRASAEVRDKDKCSRPLIVLIIFFLIVGVIAAFVLGITLQVVMKGGDSSAGSKNLCGNYSHLYYPAFDTYPGNCGKYIYCVNGSEGEVKQCADGLEYAFDMTSDPAKVCAAPSELTYCGKLRIDAAPTVTLDLAPYVTAFLNNTVVVECIVRNVRTVSQVTFLHDDTIVASFNPSHRTVATMQQGASVVRQEVEGGYNVTLILTNVTCGDEGRYWCLANDSRGNVEKWTTISVMSQPTAPTLVVYPIVENFTIENPNCTADNLGFGPAMTFAWTLTRENGIETSFNISRMTLESSSNTQTCTTRGSSVLDTQNYTGGSWNNSVLCCKLTDPKTGRVVKEDCKKMYTLPADFCTGYNNTARYYPYEPCNTYVECDNGIPIFKYCNNGSCIDPVTRICNLPKTTQTTSV